MDKTIKKHLVDTLFQSIGNKQYLNDIEKVLDRVELSPQELESFRYLARDIRELRDKANRSDASPMRPFRFV